MADEASHRRTGRALRWGLFGVGYLACYFLSTALPTPLLWYYPVERRFALEVHPRGLAADYYGRVLLCLMAGALAMAASRLVLRHLDEQAQSRWLRRALAWSAALLVFTAGLYVYMLAGRLPFPAPLPPGYVPR